MRGENCGDESVCVESQTGKGECVMKRRVINYQVI